MKEFCYKPVETKEIPQKSTVGVKFGNDIFLLQSFLDKNNIEYKKEDLEETPLGLAYRIKKNDIPIHTGSM